MKAKFFFVAMAAIAVIGCQKESGVQGEASGMASFLKVNLNTAGAITKAEPGSFEYGSDAENLVNSVTFYFFDAAGEKYVVQNRENYMTGNVTDWKAGTVENIEEISGLVLVIRQAQNGEHPAQMVAVLNAPAALKKSMTLAELNAQIETLYDESNGFIMSNSVYENGAGTVIKTTAITEDNLFSANLKEGEPGYNAPGTILKPEDVPAGAPVEIYVERVAAKVRVNNDPATLLPVYAEDGTTQMVDTKDTPVYVKIEGWDVTNNTDESYILKQLSATYDPAPFTPWSVAAFYRSYWANTTAIPAHDLNYYALTTTSPKYYHENTDQENNPQLLVTARLVDEKGKAVDLAKWYDKHYTLADIQAAMVGSIDHRIYTRTTDEAGNTVLNSITAADVLFKQKDYKKPEKRYQVYMTEKEGVKYYDADGKEITSTVDGIDPNNTAKHILETVEPAQIWKEGMAYYYIDIQHFGETKAMVRNHCYDITIDKIKGFGTPVFDPEQIIIPEKPEDSEAMNLAARINILSWHLVKQNVIL